MPTPPNNSWSDRIVPALYRLAGAIHERTAQAFTFVEGHVLRIIRKAPLPARLAILQGLMALVGVLIVALGGARIAAWSGVEPETFSVLVKAGIARSFQILKLFFAVALALSVAGSASAFLRRRASLLLLQAASAWFLVCWLWLLRLVLRIPGTLLANVEGFDKLTRDEIWLTSVTGWLAIAWIPVLSLLALVTRPVYQHYGGTPVSDRVGDRLIAWYRHPNRDRHFRISFRWAAFLHIFIIVLPFLIRGCGWERPYPIPDGAGQEQIEVVKVKPKKIQKKWILSRDSPFLFERPEIDESVVMEEVDKITENQYEAQANPGKVGVGGGNKGGWPGGMPGKIRFIRLKYRGGDWDQDMGRGADDNFLITFKKLTGFDVEDRTEAKTVDRLRRFPKHRAPPFVYLTGKGGISLSAKDIKTLRWYCLEEGGMIWADNGGGSFDGSFRQLMRRIFPDKQLLDIANDDPIYRQPFGFPSGAPPLWHHSGYRALGIRHNGRWCVFYHQGDMNDAWKDHGDANEAVSMQSFKMGINIAHYAFTTYLSLHQQTEDK